MTPGGQGTERPGARIRFDWSVLRVVPKVHREEFVNVGVLLFAPTQECLLARIATEEQIAQRSALKLPESVRHQLEAIRRIAAGAADAGPIAAMSPSRRFHWLTAPRSAVLQSSPVRVGLSHDLEETLEHLFEEQCG